jgi:polyphosphate kinase 2 (PPK2 family)
MVQRTDTAAAPWRLVEAESKPYARVKVMETTISATEDGLRERGHEPPPPL